MELTPQAVSEAEFREAKRGGYNIRDVDDFLDRVAIGVGQLQEHLREVYQRAESAEGRLADMQRQLDEARHAALQAQENVGGGAALPPGETDETLRRTLVLAQRTADATIQDAKDEATRILDSARQEAARAAHASVEANAMGDVSAAREQAQDDVDRLLDRRDEIAGEIAKLEDHLATQRDNIRVGIEELLRLLDGPSSLQIEPAPLVSAEPRRAPSDEDPPASLSPPADEPASPFGSSVPSAADAFLPSSPPASLPPASNGQADGNGFVPGDRLSSSALSSGGSPPSPPSGFMPSSLGSGSPVESEPLFGGDQQPPFGDTSSPFGEPQAPYGESPSPFGEAFGAEPERPPLPSRDGLPSALPESREPLPSRDPLPARDPLESREPPPLESRDRLPRREGSNVADLQEMPPFSPGNSIPDEAGAPLFPSSLGPPPGATGFLPDLPAAPGPEDQGRGAGVPLDTNGFPGPPSQGNDGLLPIDGPPPPPPPMGLENMPDAAGIPLDANSRPSEWGRGVFDDDFDDDGNGTRFGRN